MPHAKRAQIILIYSTILTALYYCALGFLPKEIRNYAVQLFTTARGHGFLFFSAAAIPVLLAGYRLKQNGITSTVVGGKFLFLSVAMLIDFLIDTLLGWNAASTWVLRVFWLIGFFYGITVFSLGKKSFNEKWRVFLKAGRVEKLFLFLCFFFLLRQTFAFFYNRGGPFADEINFWHTAAVDFLNGGFQQVSRHTYTLAVPWLASIPATLFGGTHTEHVYAYSSYIVFGSVFLIAELAKNARSLLAGWGTLLLCFVLQRDLFSLYGGSLYGEGLATLLVAVLMAEFFFLRQRKKISRRLLLGFAGIAALASISKPPLAYVVWLSIAWLILLKQPWQSRVVLLMAFLHYAPWRIWLFTQNKGTYYDGFSLSTIFENGVNFSIPLKMLSGLMNYGTPQFAYTVALLIAIAHVLLLKNYKILRMFAVLIGVYWGFVFALYATLWQHMEQFSAGRYISHAAIACVLLLPLAFSDEKHAHT